MGKFDREYVSEFTHFIHRYLEEHPEVVADQERGRSIYWDKQVDLDELRRAESAAVPVDSYYYFGNPWDPAARSAPEPSSQEPSSPAPSSSPRRSS